MHSIKYAYGDWTFDPYFFFLPEILIQQVQCAGKHLDMVASHLTQVEKTLLFHEDEVDSVSVMEVLESVSEVKNEYENLHKDIKEVQQLQKEMTVSLHNQLQSLRHTFRVLKKRLEQQSEPLPTLSIKSLDSSPHRTHR